MSDKVEDLLGEVARLDGDLQHLTARPQDYTVVRTSIELVHRNGHLTPHITLELELKEP